MTRRGSVRWAIALWLVFAFVVWNVIFDRMIVLAGRRYSYDAYLLFHTTGRYLLINDVMRPAVARAFRTATLTAVGIVAISVGLIRLAVRLDGRSHEVTKSTKDARAHH